MTRFAAPLVITLLSVSFFFFIWHARKHPAPSDSNFLQAYQDEAPPSSTPNGAIHVDGALFFHTRFSINQNLEDSINWLAQRCEGLGQLTALQSSYETPGFSEVTGPPKSTLHFMDADYGVVSCIAQNTMGSKELRYIYMRQSKATTHGVALWKHLDPSSTLHSKTSTIQRSASAAAQFSFLRSAQLKHQAVDQRSGWQWEVFSFPQRSTKAIDKALRNTLRKKGWHTLTHKPTHTHQNTPTVLYAALGNQSIFVTIGLEDSAKNTTIGILQNGAPLTYEE